MSTPIAAVTIGPGVALPRTPPPYVPRFPSAKVRLYDGSFSPGALAEMLKSSAVTGWRDDDRNSNRVYTAPTAGTTHVVTWNYQPEVGNYNVICVLWNNIAVASPTAAGWTKLEEQLGQTGLAMAVYGREAAVGDSMTVTFTFGSSVTASAQADEFVNVATASQLDKTAKNTGTVSGAGTTMSTGTTAATAQANEIDVGFFHIGTMGIDTVTHSAGFTGLTIRDAAGGQVIAGFKITSATGTQNDTITITNDVGSSIKYAGIIVTLKGNATPTTFRPLGELSLVQGRATMRTSQLGDFELRVSAKDPAYSLVKENVIVEFFVPDQPIVWSLGFFVIRQITVDESKPTTVKIVRGKDLRDWIGTRGLIQPVVTSQRGSYSNLSAEDWVRQYITATCITITPVTGYPSDPVYGLALEATNGHRGTVYSVAPAIAGSPLTQTITQLLATDNLGWRLVLVNPGTSTGIMQVQIYAGTDRTFGIGTAECVFAKNFDTAKDVQATDDAIDAVDALTVKGAPQDNSTRQIVYVEDAAAKAKWGILYGQRDASTEGTGLTAVSAAAYLKQLLPKSYAKIEPRINSRLRPYHNYWLLDRVSAITQDGRRYDGPITSIALDVSNNPGGYEFGDMDVFQTGNPADSMIVRGWWQYGPPLITLTVADDPELPNAPKDVYASQLHEYTYLPNLAKSVTEINALPTSSSIIATQTFVSIQPDLSTLTKSAAEINALPTSSSIMATQTFVSAQPDLSTLTKTATDINGIANGATNNTRTGTGAAANKPTALGTQTVRDTTASGGLSADQSDTQAAYDAIRTKLNDFITKYSAILDQIKHTGGSDVLND